LIDDKEKAVTSIVPSAGTGLVASTSGLVRRGLQELSNRQNERSLVVPADVRRRILVVDDEEALVEVFGMVLDSAGYDVRSTLNAIEAIEIARTFKPDLAFVGLIMPRLDGIKLNAELLKILPRLKIIFIAEAEPDDLEAFRKINPTCGVLPSPFEKQELFDKTRSWIAEAVELQRPRVMVVSTEEGLSEGKRLVWTVWTKCE
jgi:CheY-like chemotaxis protein